MQQIQLLQEEKPLWIKLLKESITTVDELIEIYDGQINKKEIERVIKKYPMNINKYFISLIKKNNDSIWKQCIPNIRELDEKGLEDPLCEERDSPVPGLTHRYPDRVLFLVCNRCAMYCRFCTRKRKVGDPFKRITKEQIIVGMDYIKKHKEIRDVLLSGGDPLLLSDPYLDWILKELKKIPHIQIIRIGTRIPCVLPQRITPELCNILKKYQPLYINIHFSHPDEITPESKTACNMLADSGLILGSQTVLLKGVNDKPEIIKELMHKLLQIRVKPYYIYQCDPVKGAEHFITPVESGIGIMRKMIGFTSGLAVPKFVIDAPGGGGKIPIFPNYIEGIEGKKIKLCNYQNKHFEYIEP